MTIEPRNQMTRIIKKYLSSKYGNKNVSVRNSSGTAYGWINISIKGEKDKSWNKSVEIEKELVELLKDNGLSFYTYLADEGYGTKSNCVLIDFQ